MDFKKNLLTIILLCSAAAINAKADMDSSPIVVVDLMRVGAEAKEFKKKQEDAKAEIDAKVKEIEALDRKFQNNLSDLQASAKDLSSTALERKQEELGKLQGEIEVKKRNLQAHVQKVMASAEKDLVDKVKAICKNLGFKVVLPGALYVDDAYDRTDTVIKELNKNTSSKKK